MENQTKWALARKGQLDEGDCCLARKGYLDPSDEQFGENRFTRRLGWILSRGEPKVEPASAWVSFVACPDEPVSDAIPVNSDEFWKWFDPTLRLYAPRKDLGFLPRSTNRMTLDDALWLHEEWLSDELKCTMGFVCVERNGFAEMAWTAAYTFRERIAFPFVPIMTRFWQFVEFVLDLYREYDLNQPFKLLLNMKNTARTVLSDLGERWLGPFDDTFGQRFAPECWEPNVQIVQRLDNLELESDDVENLVRHFATRIDNAYGQRQPRCYNHPEADTDQRLPVDSVRARW